MTPITKRLTVFLMLAGIVAPAYFLTGASLPSERPVMEIVLSGPINDKAAELSGLAWYTFDGKDYLILMPQYPGRFKSKSGGTIFALLKENIIRVLPGKTKKDKPQPLTPIEIGFSAPGLEEKIDGFEGFEAIGFYRGIVFMTIEAKPAAGGMKGHLIKGKIDMTSKKLVLDVHNIAEIDAQAPVNNAAYETVLVTGDSVMAIYEGNGRNINKSPVAYQYDHDLKFIGKIPFPNIEWRITDATAMDSLNRFWCINYFWPSKKEKMGYKPALPNPKSRMARKGLTHSKSEVIERFVQLEYSRGNLTGSGKSKQGRFFITRKKPVWLKLQDQNNDGRVDKKDSRNWEGIVRLDGKGFLVVTDMFPRTILGFVGYW